MIFKLTWEAILDGRKTQTRRLVKPGDLCPLIINDCCMGIMRNDRLIWQVGHSYAIQPGRGKKAVGRICITGIRREHLWDITEKDCEAEVGHRAFPGASAYFIKLWSEIHTVPGTRWGDNPEVWVLEFEVMKEPSSAKSEE